MANRQFTTLKLTDGELFEKLDGIRTNFAPDKNPHVNVNFGGGQALGTTLGQLREHPAIQTLLSARAALTATVGVNFQDKRSFTVERRDGHDLVTVTFPDDADPALVAKYLAVIAQHLPIYDAAATLNRALGPELAEFYSRREQSLLRLESTTQQLIEQNVSFRTTLEQELAERRAELTASTAAEEQRLRSEYDAKEHDLQEREAALAEDLKRLNDLSSRRARRRIHEELKKSLASRSSDFALTTATIKKRRPLHYLFVVLAAIPGSIFVWSVVELIRHGPPSSLPDMLRLPLSAAAAAAALIFYIRWNDSWFTQHAEEEFRLKRLDLDIDRASYVVEMALEWKEEKGSELPQGLVEPLTRNLFSETDTGGRARHPSEDLASALLDASSGLNLRIPGVGEARLNKRSLRKFKKAAKEASDTS